MTLMSNRLVMRGRGLARGLGLTRVAGRLFGRREDRFAKAMRAAILEGDVVWDVGANLGHYARRFSEWVGPGGEVVCFEPSPRNLQRLRRACEPSANASVIACALSDRNGTTAFVEDTEAGGANARIAAGQTRDPNVIEVPVRCGDDLIAAGEARRPGVVKIDVEGHEYAVLQGLRRLLAERSVRHLFVEVHFKLLDGDGRADDVPRMIALLRDCGYSIRWLGTSHFAAHLR